MTMQNGGFFDNLDIFNASETGNRAFFNSFLPTGATANQRNNFFGLFTPTFNSFLGEMGAQIRQGQAPQQTFTDFIEQQFDPQRELLRFNNAPQAGAPGSTIFRFN